MSEIKSPAKPRPVATKKPELANVMFSMLDVAKHLKAQTMEEIHTAITMYSNGVPLSGVIVAASDYVLLLKTSENDIIQVRYSDILKMKHSLKITKN